MARNLMAELAEVQKRLGVLRARERELVTEIREAIGVRLAADWRRYPTQKTRPESVFHRALAALRDEPMTTRELSRKFPDASPSYIQTVLSRARAGGMVDRSPNGVWFIVAKLADGPAE